ncbi:hypothetical protein ELP57_34070, partial [Klebsiella pneumoniae]|nr:hypothetical protein [Klebsiella pneumoniae]
STLLASSAASDVYKRQRYPPKGFKKLWRKYLLSPEAQKVIEYAQDTSSRVLPLVQYIGQFSSIINWIAGGIKVFSDSRLAVDQKTTTKLRAEIAGQLVSLDPVSYTHLR